MGCGESKAVEALNGTSVMLEKKLVSAVVDAKRRKSFKVKKSSFNNLMLQFPKLRTGFKKVRELFKQLDSNKDGRVEWTEFHELCPTIGLDPESTTLQELFALADMDNRQAINMTEFVLVFTIIYLLDSNKKSAIVYPEIKRALDIVERAFCFFDSSADGCLERKEMALAMKSGTRVFGRKQSKSLADKLFDQLDWDGSGRITFKEFLVGIERMVMEDDDADYGDDDDDDDTELQDLDDWDDDAEDDDDRRGQRQF